MKEKGKLKKFIYVHNDENYDVVLAYNLLE